MASGWFLTDDEVAKRVEIHGREHLERALAAGHGVLLVERALHVDRGGCRGAAHDRSRLRCMYRPQRNAMMDTLVMRGRGRFATAQIPRDDVRRCCASCAPTARSRTCPTRLISASKRALAVLRRAGADQHCDEQARCNQRRRRAAVLLSPVTWDAGYRVDIGPPLADFPSDDPAADARRVLRPARGLHPARARAISLDVQEVQRPARAFPGHLFDSDTGARQDTAEHRGQDSMRTRWPNRSASTSGPGTHRARAEQSIDSAS